VPKNKYHPTSDYLVDWLKAVRFLWRVFRSPGSRKIRERRLRLARPAFRDVSKFGGQYWYLPMSMSSLLTG
jgi:hypothetical protein